MLLEDMEARDKWIEEARKALRTASRAAGKLQAEYARRTIEPRFEFDLLINDSEKIKRLLREKL